MGKRDYSIGPGHPNFGDGTTGHNGYVLLSSQIWGEDQGRYQHRVVAEEALGRKLLPSEIVHHKNGDKRDNRPENLEVLSRPQHNRLHGRGELLRCLDCGAERWYSPAQIAALYKGGADYRCRPCSQKATYTKDCSKCGSSFQGGRTAYLCAACMIDPRKGRNRKR